MAPNKKKSRSKERDVAPLLKGVTVRLSRSAPAPVSGLSRQTSSIATENESGYTLGQRVRHDKFGEGVVLNYEGQGSQARVQVNFNSGGSKWLMLSYAKLEVV